MTQDNPQQVLGPPMIAATAILRPPPTRVGSIGDISLPRAYQLKNIIAASVAGSVGLLFSVLFSSNFTAIAFVTALFGALGIGLVNYSPLKGETLLRALGLSLTSRRHRAAFWQGSHVQVFVGTHKVTELPPNRIILRPGSAAVHLDNVDERGVVRSKDQRNLEGMKYTPWPIWDISWAEYKKVKKTEETEAVQTPESNLDSVLFGSSDELSPRSAVARLRGARPAVKNTQEAVQAPPEPNKALERLQNMPRRRDHDDDDGQQD